MTTPLAARIAREYGTPCAVIDMNRVERNIARIQKACEAAGLANRPHIKTHKSPLLAKMQVASGAHGITCQKLGEAEVMAEAGIDDILISYNLVGEEKMARLAALQAKANVTVAADNSTVIAGLPQAAAATEPPMSDFNSAFYTCDEGAAFSVTYDGKRPKTAELTTSNNNKHYALKRTSAKDAPTFAGNGVTFTVRGDTAEVTGTDLSMPAMIGMIMRRFCRLMRR